MASQRHFILRHRDHGHVRFQIPPAFCQDHTAKALAAALLRIQGVYRVKVYRGQRKLSIRYQESHCGFEALAKQLHGLIAKLEGAQVPATTARPPRRLFGKLQEAVKDAPPSRWLGQKWTEAKETALAAKLLVNGLKKNKAIIDNPRQFVGDFLNDVLALYLIKLHWEPITKQWIPNPWRHRYEWLAVSYLLYLLMRSRNPKP